jgi:hypothetical protein
MTGGLNSVIGMRRDQALQRFLTGRPQRFEPEKEGFMLSAVCVEIDADTGRALSIRRETMSGSEDGIQEL